MTENIHLSLCQKKYRSSMDLPKQDQTGLKTWVRYRFPNCASQQTTGIRVDSSGINRIIVLVFVSHRLRINFFSSFLVVIIVMVVA